MSMNLDDLRNAIDIGIQQIERGEFIEIADEQELKAFFDDIEKRGQRRFPIEPKQP